MCSAGIGIDTMIQRESIKGLYYCECMRETKLVSSSWISKWKYDFISYFLLYDHDFCFDSIIAFITAYNVGINYISGFCIGELIFCNINMR